MLCEALFLHITSGCLCFHWSALVCLCAGSNASFCTYAPGCALLSFYYDVMILFGRQQRECTYSEVLSVMRTFPICDESKLTSLDSLVLMLRLSVIAASWPRLCSAVVPPHCPSPLRVFSLWNSHSFQLWGLWNKASLPLTHSQYLITNYISPDSGDLI